MAGAVLSSSSLHCAKAQTLESFYPHTPQLLTKAFHMDFNRTRMLEKSYTHAFSK